MGNLVEDLGERYCNQLVAGAMFVKDGKPHQFRAVSEDGTSVECFCYSVHAEKPEREVVRIPWDYFQDWSSLGHPTLGYRQAMKNQLIAYVSRNNSTRRGLHAADTRIAITDMSYEVSRVYDVSFNSITHGEGMIPFVMAPAYTGFTNGLAQVLKGQIPGFAVSADFAVMPSTEVPFLGVYFRQRLIGTIDENGNISFTAADMLPSWQFATTNGEIHE